MGPIAVINLLLTVIQHQFGLGLVTVGDNLPWLICHQPMIRILIKCYCSKKGNVFFLYICACSMIMEIYKKGEY